jgi:hypothetical protein
MVYWNEFLQKFCGLELSKRFLKRTFNLSLFSGETKLSKYHVFSLFLQKKDFG